MKAAAANRPEVKFSDLSELFKARLSFLVIITTLVGFLAAWRGPLDYLVFTATLIGTALSAFGASALNQWFERDVDALMRRTRDRPLPARRMSARDGLMLGLLFSIAGVACLGFFVNGLSAALAALTVVSYVWLYTPLKRISTLNTLVGAVPGALPPLIGWAAAADGIQFGGVVLFMILWFWQMPHFMAIAWMYREDYARAGFKMLSVADEGGVVSARQSV
ncbi:MAG TPA: heme o synthase, partial [Chthoniobacterales bacterium]